MGADVDAAPTDRSKFKRTNKMKLMPVTEFSPDLVEDLNYKDKVERSLNLISNAYAQHKEGLIVANSLGKDSMVVWHLATRVSDKIKGFIITTRHKPPETKDFMHEMVAKYSGRLQVFSYDGWIVKDLHKTDPDKCCDTLKVNPTRQALLTYSASCWVTGLRCTEGRTRADFQEIEHRDFGLEKLNPILVWSEREVWQYIALNKVDINPLYAQGYRSLGCAPCTSISSGPDERAGRWMNTSKCGGECGIHTRPLISGTRT